MDHRAAMEGTGDGATATLSPNGEHHCMRELVMGLRVRWLVHTWVDHLSWTTCHHLPTLHRVLPWETQWVVPQVWVPTPQAWLPKITLGTLCTPLSSPAKRLPWWYRPGHDGVQCAWTTHANPASALGGSWLSLWLQTTYDRSIQLLGLNEVLLSRIKWPTNIWKLLLICKAKEQWAKTLVATLLTYIFHHIRTHAKPVPPHTRFTWCSAPLELWVVSFLMFLKASSLLPGPVWTLTSMSITGQEPRSWGDSFSQAATGAI